MILSVKERILIGTIYPKESNIITQTLVRDISNKVRIEQPEMIEIDFKQSPNGVTWDDKKAKNLDVSFSELELNLLKERVKDLDNQKKITQENLDLCVKIKNEEVKK